MNLQTVVSSPSVMRLAMFLSRSISPRWGDRIAWTTAGLVCRLKPSVHQIVQANLGQVLGPDADETALHETTRQVFNTSVRSYYDLYRAIQLPPEEMVASVEIPEESMAVARSMWDRDGGTVMVVPHLGNFDLGAPALVPHAPEMQAISLADPPPGFQLANEMRRKAGFAVTPMGPQALRQAIRVLRRGGVVGIGGDRPVSDLDAPIPFFGRPARVPSGHVRLALKTGAAIVMGCCYFSPEMTKYVLHLEPAMELVRTGDRDEDIRLNMRRVLDRLEAIIRRWPGQWLMFVPVWPELLGE
jgi:KDO2-lipid IV(A) lauroyltransferase